MVDKDWEKRRELATKVNVLLARKVTHRAELLIARAYLYGGLVKPLDELTDKELLAEPLIGPKTVEEIRTVIPSPSR